MKKTLLKTLGTAIVIVLLVVILYHIRKYYNINPRVWFFVIYGISIICLTAIWFLFYPEIKMIQKHFKTYSFLECMTDIMEEVSQKIKPTIEEIANNDLFSLIVSIITIVAFPGALYVMLFFEDFIGNIVPYIFLTLLVFLALSRLIRAIGMEGKKRITEFIRFVSCILMLLLFRVSL